MAEIVLIVEDESDLANTLEYNLQNEGYRTQCALTGQNALEIIEKEPAPNLVLLDLMLPDISGIEICRRIRALDRTQHIPVVMVTAKGEEIDRVVGFEIGADDYVVKPYSIRELILRIRAVLRRGEIPKEIDKVSQFGSLRVDQSGHRIWAEGEEIALTALEFKLLLLLLERKGRVQSRDMLLSDVWGIKTDTNTRTVDTHIKRLRQKLGSAGEYIETLRGIGYRFRSD